MGVAEVAGVAEAGAAAAGDPEDEHHSDAILCRRLTVCTGFSFVLFLMQGMCEFHVTFVFPILYIKMFVLNTETFVLELLPLPCPSISTVCVCACRRLDQS